MGSVSVIVMSRYRLLPTPDQEIGLLEHARHARYVWNLAVEQHAHWQPGRCSAPGYVEQSGRRVRQKVGLNRAILTSAWGMLVSRLEHKAAGRVEKIDPAYTSRTCWACGHRAVESRESQASFRCVACGFRSNADVNAARNIAAGRAVTARGALQPPGGAVNREPQLDTSLVG